MAGGSEVAIAQGPHRAEVVLTRTGPGPRLRLGWTWPARDGRPGGYDEILLPRDLGPPIARAWWWLTDALSVAAAVLVAVLLWRLPWDVPRPPPVASAVTRGEIGWSLAGYAALVALMSWPLVTDLAGLGVMDRPDGRLNAWILAWDAHALAHAPSRLFQAPIFHPLPDTLAFSENLLLPAVIGAPAQALGGPVLAYNVVLLVSLIVSGLGVQLLVRRESGDRWAAFIAGAFFAAGAHRWIRLAHLHAQVTLFLPFVLLALDRFWQRRTLGRAALVGVLLALQGLSSVYLGAIAALMVAVAAALAILGGLQAPRDGRLADRPRPGRPSPGADRPPLPAHARVRGRGVHDRGRGQLCHHDRVLRGRGHAPVRAGDAEASRSCARPGHALPWPGRAGLRADRPRLRPAPLPPPGRDRVRGGHRLLARSGDGRLPVPARAPRVRARRARVVAVLARARARALRPGRVRAGPAAGGWRCSSSGCSSWNRATCRFATRRRPSRPTRHAGWRGSRAQWPSCPSAKGTPR